MSKESNYPQVRSEMMLLSRIIWSITGVGVDIYYIPKVYDFLLDFSVLINHIPLSCHSIHWPYL